MQRDTLRSPATMKNFMLAALTFLLILQRSDSSIFLRQADISTDQVVTTSSTRANINDYFDRLVTQLQSQLVERGYDPMPLPDTKFYYNMTDLIGIHWTVEFGFIHGKLRHLSHIKRAGDVTLDYENSTIDVSAVISFDTLELDYEFVAELMDVGPDASVTATITGLVVEVKLRINLATKKAELEDLRMLEATSIKVRVKGLFLADIVVDAVADFITAFFKDVIIKLAERRVREETERAVASFDVGSIVG